MRFLEPGIFGGRIAACQCRIAVREAAEADDNVAMANGEFQGGRASQAPYQANATVLITARLAVMERHIQE
jgi:hypothetical protein